MPLYNAAPFVRAALESILAQDYRDLELIVVDDGSTDGGPAIVRQVDDPRIVLLENGANRGIVFSRNRALERVTGEYVCPLDGDDVAAPGRISAQVAFLDAHPRVGLVGGQSDVIDATGRKVGEERFPCTDAEIRRVLFVHNPFVQSASMFRSSAIRGGGTYDPRFESTEDYDLWLRIASKHEVENLPEVMVLRRVHGTSISVRRERRLVRNRLFTLVHAITHYYRDPRLAVHLVRPALAFLARLLGVRRTKAQPFHRAG
jgi:glycosyltransferase involved in cell wall biosynthesis